MFLNPPLKPDPVNRTFLLGTIRTLSFGGDKIGPTCCRASAAVISSQRSVEFQEIDLSPSDAIHRTCAMAVILCAVAVQAAAQTNSYTPPPSPRAKLNFDLNWKFIRDDVSGAEAPGFDDSCW